MNQKVYVVMCRIEYESYSMVKVFSNEDSANNYKHSCAEENEDPHTIFSVDEWELNE